MILLSAGIAVLLWLYVVTVVSPNSDKYFYNVPVKLQGEYLLGQRELMITSGELPTVTLHLEGNRTDLNKINSGLIDIYVDVSEINGTDLYEVQPDGTRVYKPKEYTLPLTDPSFRTNVANSSITVASKDPATVKITVEEQETKPVPVDIQWIGKQHPDYTVDKDNKILNHTEVNITGPKSVIDQIKMARIDVDIDGRTESISGRYQYTLCNEKGEPVDAALVIADVESINLDLKILRTKKVDLEVVWIPGGGLKAEDCKIKIEPATIEISGSDALLEKHPTWILAEINLAEVLESTTLTLPIEMEEGISNVTGVTEAKVTITLPELETRELTVTNIQTVNKPENLNMEIKTAQLRVKLRGNKKKLDSVKAEDITVTVDLADQGTGKVTKNAVVTVDVDGVGALDVYEVTVELTEPQ